VLRFRHGFPEDWKNLVSFWMKIDEEKKRHAENMSFIWNSTVTNNMSLATGKSQKTEDSVPVGKLQGKNMKK
jgi:hypothetical protein